MLLLVGNSVDEMEGLNLPPRPKGWNSDRMHIKDFRVRLVSTSPTSCTVNVIFNFDAKLSIPKPFLNYINKKLAGLLLYCIRREALKSAADPIHSPYGIRMRTHPFYIDYLVPRLKSYFHKMGWGPLVVPSLGGALKDMEEMESRAAECKEEIKEDTLFDSPPRQRRGLAPIDSIEDVTEEVAPLEVAAPAPLEADRSAPVVEDLVPTVQAREAVRHNRKENAMVYGLVSVLFISYWVVGTALYSIVSGTAPDYSLPGWMPH